MAGILQMAFSDSGFFFSFDHKLKHVVNGMIDMLILVHVMAWALIQYKEVILPV